MIDYVEDNIVFLIWKVLNSRNLSIVSEKKSFAENPQIKFDNFQKQKHGYLIYTWSEKVWKGYCCKSDIATLSMEIPFIASSKHVLNKNTCFFYKSRFYKQLPWFILFKELQIFL